MSSGSKIPTDMVTQNITCSGMSQPTCTLKKEETQYHATYVYNEMLSVAKFRIRLFLATCTEPQIGWSQEFAQKITIHHSGRSLLLT